MDPRKFEAVELERRLVATITITIKITLTITNNNDTNLRGDPRKFDAGELVRRLVARLEAASVSGTWDPVLKDGLELL